MAWWISLKFGKNSYQVKMQLSHLLVAMVIRILKRFWVQRCQIYGFEALDSKWLDGLLWNLAKIAVKLRCNSLTYWLPQCSKFWRDFECKEVKLLVFELWIQDGLMDFFETWHVQPWSQDTTLSPTGCHGDQNFEENLSTKWSHYWFLISGFKLAWNLTSDAITARHIWLTCWLPWTFVPGIPNDIYPCSRDHKVNFPWGTVWKRSVAETFHVTWDNLLGQRIGTFVPAIPKQRLPTFPWHRSYNFPRGTVQKRSVAETFHVTWDNLLGQRIGMFVPAIPKRCLPSFPWPRSYNFPRVTVRKWSVVETFHVTWDNLLGQRIGTCVPTFPKRRLPSFPWPRSYNFPRDTVGHNFRTTGISI